MLTHTRPRRIQQQTSYLPQNTYNPTNDWLALVHHATGIYKITKSSLSDICWQLIDENVIEMVMDHPDTLLAGASAEAETMRYQKQEGVLWFDLPEDSPRARLMWNKMRQIAKECAHTWLFIYAQTELQTSGINVDNEVITDKPIQK